MGKAVCALRVLSHYTQVWERENKKEREKREERKGLQASVPVKWLADHL